MRVLFSILLLLISSISYAGDRELASEGSDVRLTIDKKYKCSKVAPIRIVTSSAAYFDQSADVIQRLADVSRAVLGFECSKIKKIEFRGFTNDVEVFGADAQSDSNWTIESYPAPLEGLALYFSLKEPEFFHLGTISNQLQHFQKVEGIQDTYQFHAYEQQAKRLVSIVDGDTDKFKAYLKNPGRTFENFEQVIAHYSDVLKTIEIYSPDYLQSYKKTYEEITNSLKDEYWSSRVSSIVDENDRNVEGMITDFNKLLKSSESKEFRAYVDTQISTSILDETNIIKLQVNDSPLLELAQISDYISTFPNPDKAKNLPRTKQLLESAPNQLLPRILKRKDELYELAVNIIQVSGTSYSDVDSIFETGFALAKEFEDENFISDGRSLLAHTFKYIDGVLGQGLADYQKEIESIELTGTSATKLQEQSLSFEELSSEFEGFKAYQKATEEILESNKDEICIGILKEALIDKEDYKQIIILESEQVALNELSCKLYENGHIVSKFIWSEEDPKVAALSINESEGKQSHFTLIKETKGLTIKSLESDDKNKDSSKDPQRYFTNLIYQQPSGLPDANGIRECDRLAADPHDPKKLSAGFDFEKQEVDEEVFDRAIDACIVAVENDPNDPRQLYQLGRLMIYAGDIESASQFINRSAKQKYAAAIYHKAEILLSKSDSHNAFVDALNMFFTSGKAGYEQGLAMVKELNLEGIRYYKEIAPPSPKHILNALPIKNLGGTMAGYTTRIRVSNVKVRECFQTTARDFSCEFRKILSCSFSGNAHPFLMNIARSAMQQDCNATEFEFETFRKLKGGKWKMIPN